MGSVVSSNAKTLLIVLENTLNIIVTQVGVKIVQIQIVQSNASMEIVLFINLIVSMGNAIKISA